MKRIISVLLIAIMIIPTLISCTKEGATNMTATTAAESTPKTPKPNANEQILGYLKTWSDDAYANVIKNYWEKADGLEYFHNRYKENRTSLNDIVFTTAMMLLSLETYAEASGKQSEFKSLLAKQVDAWYKKLPKSWLLSTGKNNNPAHDDASWTAMTFLMQYKLNGDEKALDYCHEMIVNSYDYWQDGSTANGLWYCYPEDLGSTDMIRKGLSCVGLMYPALEYYRLTKGTKKEDPELYRRTIDLYNWAEENMRRNGEKEWNGKKYYFDDNLFFMEFIDNKETGEKYPLGVDRTGDFLVQSHSFSCMFVNMGMSVINKQLYDITGEDIYRERAVATANAFVYTEYNQSGAFMNDRDAWGNSIFVGYFIREVMQLEGIDPELSRMFLKTAVSIMKNAYYEGGFYTADWDGSGTWFEYDTIGGERTTWIMTNGTTTHMIFAAYYLMKNGYIKVSDKDIKMFEGKFHIGKLDDKGFVIG